MTQLSICEMRRWRKEIASWREGLRLSVERTLTAIRVASKILGMQLAS